MVKRQVVAERLGHLRDYLRVLKQLRRHPLKQFLSEPLLRGAAERYLHLAIASCLDLGNHVIADRGLRKPQDYKDVFLVLGEAKILPPAFAKRLAPMAGLRNILVHDYLRVDPAKIHTFLKTHLGDFERFARAFERFL